MSLFKEIPMNEINLLKNELDFFRDLITVFDKKIKTVELSSSLEDKDSLHPACHLDSTSDEILLFKTPSNKHGLAIPVKGKYVVMHYHYYGDYNKKYNFIIEWPSEFDLGLSNEDFSEYSIIKAVNTIRETIDMIEKIN